MNPSEAAADAEQYTSRPRIESERQVLELQVLALILLGEIDRFQRHPELVAELIGDLRIQLAIVAIPYAQRARDAVVGAEGRYRIREPEIAVERLVAPAVGHPRLEPVILIVELDVESVLGHAGDRQVLIVIVEGRRFGLRVRVVDVEAYTPIERVLRAELDALDGAAVAVDGNLHRSFASAGLVHHEDRLRHDGDEGIDLLPEGRHGHQAL